MKISSSFPFPRFGIGIGLVPVGSAGAAEYRLNSVHN